MTTPETAQRALDVLLRFPLITVVDEALLRRAYELATELNLPTAYDAQYLAVAQRYECDFWTADEHLFNVATGSVPRTFWLGNMALGGTDEATE